MKRMIKIIEIGIELNVQEVKRSLDILYLYLY